MKYIIIKKELIYIIKARKIKINGDILSLEYKSDLDKDYESLMYDIKKDKIIETRVKEISETREEILYSHLINPILNLYKEGNLEETFVRMWG